MDINYHFKEIKALLQRNTSSILQNPIFVEWRNRNKDLPKNRKIRTVDPLVK
ncbi:hypothetical protein FB550_105222 [Neobacillus bataviensis]|uniref:Uncharacterized protein n=1 Tax=Neobacillus bataviensis TaxID=220685 RepID=A0A561DES5_9BACI|nr:hypothetical protein FB550_105222 [Neobacillus bataviensis]